MSEGESTADWAIMRAGFIGSIDQLTCCARCGENLPPKRHDEPRWFFSEPVFHAICDDCYDALPEAQP